MTRDDGRRDWPLIALATASAVVVVVALILLARSFSQGTVLSRIDANQAETRCVRAVNGTYDLAKDIYTFLRLEGDQYPDDLVDELEERGVALDDLPALGEARSEYLTAYAAKQDLYDPDINPDGLCAPA